MNAKCSSGSVLGRGTSLVVSNATAFSHRVSDDLPSAPWLAILSFLVWAGRGAGCFASIIDATGMTMNDP